MVKLVIGAVIGGGLGYLYQRKIGCRSGACPITSSRIGSTIYGAALGLLLSSSF